MPLMSNWWKISNRPKFQAICKGFFGIPQDIKDVKKIRWKSVALAQCSTGEVFKPKQSETGLFINVKNVIVIVLPTNKHIEC